MRECPLNQADLCEIYEKHHTSPCNLLLGIKNHLKKQPEVEEELNYVGQRSQNSRYNVNQGKYGPQANWNQNPWSNSSQWTPPYQSQPPPTF